MWDETGQAGAFGGFRSGYRPCGEPPMERSTASTWATHSAINSASTERSTSSRRLRWTLTEPELVEGHSLAAVDSRAMLRITARYQHPMFRDSRAIEPE